MGLEKLFDFIESVWRSLLPFCILAPYESAQIARLGKKHRVIGPGGFHWIIPCNIEETYKEEVVMRTTHLGNQSLITADDHRVTLYGVVLWEIEDIEKATMNVDSLDMTVKDTFYAVSGGLVPSVRLQTLRNPAFAEQVRQRCEELTRDFGVKVLRFSFAECTDATPVRLMQG